jgi:hypothetical protein
MRTEEDSDFHQTIWKQAYQCAIQIEDGNQQEIIVEETPFDGVVQQALLSFEERCQD